MAFLTIMILTVGIFNQSDYTVSRVNWITLIARFAISILTICSTKGIHRCTFPIFYIIAGRTFWANSLETFQAIWIALSLNYNLGLHWSLYRRWLRNTFIALRDKSLTATMTNSVKRVVINAVLVNRGTNTSWGIKSISAINASPIDGINQFAVIDFEIFNAQALVWEETFTTVKANAPRYCVLAIRRKNLAQS